MLSSRVRGILHIAAGNVKTVRIAGKVVKKYADFVLDKLEDSEGSTYLDKFADILERYEFSTDIEGISVEVRYFTDIDFEGYYDLEKGNITVNTKTLVEELRDKGGSELDLRESKSYLFKLLEDNLLHFLEHEYTHGYRDKRYQGGSSGKRTTIKSLINEEKDFSALKKFYRVLVRRYSGVINFGTFEDFLKLYTRMRENISSGDVFEDILNDVNIFPDQSDYWDNHSALSNLFDSVHRHYVAHPEEQLAFVKNCSYYIYERIIGDYKGGEDPASFLLREKKFLSLLGGWINMLGYTGKAKKDFMMRVYKDLIDRLSVDSLF